MAADLVEGGDPDFPLKVSKTTPDDRSPVAVAYQWAWRIITISLEMVIPGLVGLAVDQWLGSLVVFTLLGFTFGMTVGIWHLIRIAGTTDTPGKPDSITDEETTRGDGKLP